VLPGDMATVDEEGVVTVLGRGSQCVNTGGEKVCPEEVEQALKSHPDVYDALVAGVPDATWGNHVAAVVQVRRGAARPSREDIQAHRRTRLAGYKIPRRLVVTEVIRRSPSGKADYRWAREVAVAAGRPATGDGGGASCFLLPGPLAGTVVRKLMCVAAMSPLWRRNGWAGPNRSPRNTLSRGPGRQGAGR
jgi:acyl-CoA synthetase (AMP-forming)/AMP-acid ligase II